MGNKLPLGCVRRSFYTRDQIHNLEMSKLLLDVDVTTGKARIEVAMVIFDSSLDLPKDAGWDDFEKHCLDGIKRKSGGGSFTLTVK